MFFFFPLPPANSSLLNLFPLGIFYGTIASIITWIPVPKLTQLGYSKASACSYCGSGQESSTFYTNVIHNVRPSCHKLSQGMELGFSDLNLILNGSKWNGNT
jgi:hypothetical protein